MMLGSDPRTRGLRRGRRLRRLSRGRSRANNRSARRRRRTLTPKPIMIAAVGLTPLLAHLGMLGQTKRRIGERPLPIVKMNSLAARQLERNPSPPQRLQRSRNAARHPPIAPDRDQLGANLLLRLRCVARFGFQLKERRPRRSAGNEHHVRQTRAHAPLLLQQPVEPRSRLVLEARPENFLRIDESVKLRRQRRVNPPLLATMPSPPNPSFPVVGLFVCRVQAWPLPLPGLSSGGATGGDCGIAPAMSAMLLAANIRV